MGIGTVDTIIKNLGRDHGSLAQEFVGRYLQINPYMVKKISIPIGAATTEVDTNWDLPAHAVVLDVFYNVTALEATVTFDFGTAVGESGGDPNGFIAAGVVAAVQSYRPTIGLTAGTNETYASSCLRGALLCNYHVGGNTAKNVGLVSECPYLTDSQTAKSVVYTRSAEFTTATVDVYILYMEL